MALAETTVSLNLFGTGCTIVCGTIKNEHWEKLQQQLLTENTTLEQFISNENSLRYMDLQGLKTWRDIGNEFSVKGMTDSAKSTIAVSYTHLTLPTNREV